MILNKRNKVIVKVIALIGFVIFLNACDGRPKGVLSSGKMADILVDMHKIDATLTQLNLLDVSYSFKAPYYNYILKKYGISQAQFDSSLVWYSNNPQRFENVYDDVINQLTNLQKDVYKGKFHSVDSTEIRKLKIDLWNKPTQYVLTKDSARTKLDFEINDNNLLYGDVYVLKMLLYIAHEDSCVKQHIVLRINYLNGKKDSVYRAAYNDGITRRYTFKMHANKKLQIKSISGQLLGSNAYKGKFHVKLDSIRLIRQFDPNKQDSLRKIVQKADPVNYNKSKSVSPVQPKPSPEILSKYKKIKPV